MTWLKSNFKKVIVLIIVLIAVIGYVGYKQAYKPHKTVEQREVAFVGKTSDLLVKVQSNPKQWQDVVVVLEGKLTNVETQSVSLDNAVFCQLTKAFDSTKKVGKQIQIKGRIIGYDDLLEELKLDQTVIENN